MFKKKLPLYIFISSLVIIVYVIYRDRFFNSGEQFNYYLKYYIISLSYSFFSIILFFIPKKISNNLSLFLISIFLSFYLIEAFFVVSKKKIEAKKQRSYSKIEFNTKSKFEMFNYMKTKNKDAVVKISPYHSISNQKINFFPIAGISNRETLYCNEAGYYLIYNSDRYGFNNDDSEWDKENVEYLIIGDSFAHGACVDREKNISSNLIKKIKNKKSAVLNLGYSGNGPLIELASLREFYLIKKNIKNVIWLYYEDNDLVNLDNEIKNPILKKYLDDANFKQNIFTKQKLVDNYLLKKMDEEVNRFKLYYENREALKKYAYSDFIKLRYLRKFVFKTISKKKEKKISLKYFADLLSIVKKITEDNDSRLFFVYLPEHGRYLGKNNNNSFKQYKDVKELISDIDITLIDLNEELFSKEKDPLSLFPFRNPGHYTELGYSLVSDIIYDEAKKN